MVGLPDQVAEVHAVAFPVLLKAGGLDEAKAEIESVLSRSDQNRKEAGGHVLAPLLSRFGDGLAFPHSKPVLSFLLFSLQHFNSPGRIRGTVPIPRWALRFRFVAFFFFYKSEKQTS